MPIPVYQVKIPEYNFREGKPDIDFVSSKILSCLRKHFHGRRIAFRLLGSFEHLGKSADDLVKIIKKLGYDRYNPEKLGDKYENIENKKIDFFALDFRVGNSKQEECVKWAIDSFYNWPLKTRNYPVRVDIGIVYDLSKLKIIKHRYKGREKEIKRDGFVFKDQNNKPTAVKAIIKIL